MMVESSFDICIMGLNITHQSQILSFSFFEGLAGSRHCARLWEQRGGQGRCRTREIAVAQMIPETLT